MGPWRSAGLEWVLRLAAPAFPVVQDADDDPRVGNEGDDPHAGAATAPAARKLRRLKVSMFSSARTISGACSRHSSVFEGGAAEERLAAKRCVKGIQREAEKQKQSRQPDP